jgi:N-acetylmuramoyl-L-alanine amidase
MKRFLFILIVFFVLFSISPRVIFGAEPIRILLVPGHDDEIWGAQYGNIKEADMNLRLGAELFNILKKDKRFKIWITRDHLGYTQEFADFYQKNQEAIVSFRDNAKVTMSQKVQNGDFVKKDGVPHVNVNQEVSIKLYGINKWAYDNKIDAVIHIHFNDYPRENKWEIGKHKGFAIYHPEEQMANGVSSLALAENIFTQLKRNTLSVIMNQKAKGLSQNKI